MKKITLLGLLIGLFVLVLSGCGGGDVSDSVDSAESVDTAGYEWMDKEDSGYLEAVEMAGAQNAEVEAKSDLDLPQDALVFTVLNNEKLSTYGFSFYSQMADFALKSYMDEQFLADGYSKKRDWMSFGLQVESVLYSKGQSIANVSVEDRGAHRYINVTLQD
jgi:hypothetical protein